MFVFSELVGWWDSGTVGQWGLGTGDSGMGVVSGTVGQWRMGTGDFGVGGGCGV